jgi:uncharacterized membrane protein
VPSHGVVTPRPATASPTPLGWLARGLSDLLADPLPGLLYGLIVSLLGWLILALGSHPYFIAAAVSGFVLVGPVLGAGLAELSRLRGRAEHGGFAASLDGLSRRRDGLLPLAGSLGAVAALWFLLSTLLMWVFMDEVAPTLAASLWDPAWKAMTAVEWLAWGLAGGLLAVLCFALSVVAVPVVLRGGTAAAGMRASVAACLRFPTTCALWGLLIAALVGLAFLSALLLLPLVFPLLGHATWHAAEHLAPEAASG